MRRGVQADYGSAVCICRASIWVHIASSPRPLGISPESILYTFLFSGDMVFLPYGFVSYLIFFSFGMMTTGQFAKYHAMKNVATVVFFMVVMLPYWRLIGLV